MRTAYRTMALPTVVTRASEKSTTARPIMRVHVSTVVAALLTSTPSVTLVHEVSSVAFHAIPITTTVAVMLNNDRLTLCWQQLLERHEYLMNNDIDEFTV